MIFQCLFDNKPFMNKTIQQIALLAFIIGLIAPACGFTWGGKYSVMEICSLDGTKQVVIPNGDQDPTAPTPDKLAKEKCPFCFGQKNIDQIALVDLLPSYNRIISNDTVTDSQHLISEENSSAYNPRAPPFLI